MPHASDPSKTLQLGPDLVSVEDDVLVIHAAKPIPDWTVREFRRPPIFFQGRKFYLRKRMPAKKPFAMRYELAPWPDNDHEASSLSFTYDLDFVRERDGEWKSNKLEGLIHALLLPLFPFLGFLWSGFKERKLMPLGFNPREITSASLMVGFAVICLEGVFAGWWREGFFYFVLGLPLMWDWIFLVLVGIDSVVRCDQVLRDKDLPDGFLEWLWPRKKKSP